MGFICFSGSEGVGGGGGGVFLGSHSGGSLSPHLIFTLFQSNVCKVNVREFLPRDKTEKGMSWGMCSLLITMSKNIIFTRIVRKAL